MKDAPILDLRRSPDWLPARPRPIDHWTEPMDRTHPLLSAVIVVGSRRQRAQSAVDAISAQSIAARMEIVVVDTTDPNVHADLIVAGPARAVHLRVPHGTPWGQCRSEGFHRCAAPIVAFIEDHCFAGRGWAQAVVTAFEGGHAAVGYGFVNANPRSFPSRIGMLVDYGTWQLPNVSRITTRLPGNNVAYRRDALRGFGASLGGLLETDYNLHHALTGQGETLFVAADAVAAHQNFERLLDAIASNFCSARLLATRRRERERWSVAKRLVYVVGTPLVSTPVRLGRLFESRRSRPDSSEATWFCVRSIPAISLVFWMASIGEALGYWLGAGSAHRQLFHWEVEAERTRGTDER